MDRRVWEMGMHAGKQARSWLESWPATLACGTPSAFGGGGSLHASFPALLVTVAASEQVLVSRRDAMRAPHGFSQCEQLRTEASSSLQPRHELA